MNSFLTIVKKNVTCKRCEKLMRLHDHLGPYEILRSEVEFLRFRSREKSEIIRHWQSFVAKLAKELKCIAIDDEVLKAVRKLKKRK